jgi:hypothetical protein
LFFSNTTFLYSALPFNHINPFYSPHILSSSHIGLFTVCFST